MVRTDFVPGPTMRLILCLCTSHVSACVRPPLKSFFVFSCASQDWRSTEDSGPRCSHKPHPRGTYSHDYDRALLTRESVAHTVQHRPHICRHCYRTYRLRCSIRLDADRCDRNLYKHIQCVCNLPLLMHTKLVLQLLPPSS